MKTRVSENREDKVVTNFVAIIGLVAEMARRVNENIAKVQRQPLGAALAISDTDQAGVPHVKVSKS